jgi:hypothetical protein
MARVLPAAELEKMRQSMEASEREVTEQLRSTDAVDREQNRVSLAQSLALRDGLRAELARMTPEERRMPTYLNRSNDQGPLILGEHLTADEAPPSLRVLTHNYDFWRARRSPAEARTISVQMAMSLLCLAPQIQNALWQAYHKLDWAAINDVLEQPR